MLMAGALYIYGFHFCELEQKIRREFLPIAADGLIQYFRRDAVESGKIGIEDHAFAADGVDYTVNGRDRCGRGGSLAGAHGGWRPVAGNDVEILRGVKSAPLFRRHIGVS